MHSPSSIRIRLGALALGLSAVLFAAFPLVRPYFRLDPRSPDETLAAASPVITSAPWVLSHVIAMLAFVLLIYGLLALYARLGDTHRGPSAIVGLVLSLAGIALIMPMLGVEIHILPIIGRLYLEGATNLAPAVALIYLGPATLMFLFALLLLAIGSICFALAVWRHGALPRGAGVLLAIGLALWFPPFPPSIRIIDGLVIGVGGVWLAWGIWHQPDAVPDAHR
jgi:hypothetical protein